MRHIYNEGDLPKKKKKKVWAQTYTHAGTCKLTDEHRGLTHAQTNTRDKNCWSQYALEKSAFSCQKHTHTGTSNTKNLAHNYPASKNIMFNLCLRRVSESPAFLLGMVQISRRGALHSCSVSLYWFICLLPAFTSNLITPQWSLRLPTETSDAVRLQVLLLWRVGETNRL